MSRVAKREEDTFLPSAVEEDGSLNYQELTKRYSKGRAPRRKVQRERTADAFHDAFDLIGGVPRLALWAHHDPGEFYKLYSKLFPQQIKQELDHRIQVVSMVQPTALDQDFKDVTPNAEN